MLPPEAWSDGRNVRFADNKVLKFRGHKNVFGTPTVVPYWAFPTGDAVNAYWVYANLTKLYATDGSTHSDVTRAVGGDYSTDANDFWNGGIFGGVPVITNGADDPQYQAAAGTATAFADLSNWPANTLCKLIRPYRVFLVALNVTKSGTNYPHLVKWSDASVPGAVPGSWDETDPTTLAGEVELIDAQAGPILDALQLRDILVIYKERSTWGMIYTGDRNVHRFYQIFDSLGVMSQGCVLALPQGRHLVYSGEQMYLHNGQQTEYVFDNKWHKFIANNLNENNYRRSFMVRNSVEHEAWFCFPEVGADYPTLAVVWNERDGTIGVRDLPGGISHIAAGPIPGSGSNITWDSDSEVWDDDLTVWDEQTFIPYQLQLLQSNKNTTNLQQLNQTNQFAGADMSSFIERQSLAIIGQDRQGNPKSDLEVLKLWKRIWPRVTGGPINVRVGVQDYIGGPVMWQPPQAFNPATQKYLDFIAHGRLLCTRFESNADVAWQLEGYDVEVEQAGML